MINETEDMLRINHLLDQIRELDRHVVRSEWEKAMYNVDTIGNLLMAELLKIELEAMREEKEHTNVIRIKH